MSRLTDLAPLTGSVTLRGRVLIVRPLAIDDYLSLARQHLPPSTAERLGETLGIGSVAALLPLLPPGALDAAIARALDETIEAVQTARLSAAEQMSILSVTLELGLPEGAAPGERIGRWITGVLEQPLAGLAMAAVKALQSVSATAGAGSSTS